MPWRITLLALVASCACCTACGGSGPSAATPPLVLQGPTLIDFEDRPDDGLTPLALPVVLAPGVAVTWKTGDGALYDISTADGWNLDCSVAAISGTMMLALDCDMGTEESFDITFEKLVSRVAIYAASLAGEAVWIEAFDGDGFVLHRAHATSGCPSLDASDRLEIEYETNVIRTLRVHGCWPVVDDLTYWRVP